MGFILQNLTAVIAIGISLVSLFFSARIRITSVSYQLEEKKTVFSDKLCTVKFNLSLIEVFAGYISESASTSDKGREQLNRIEEKIFKLITIIDDNYDSLISRFEGVTDSV